MKITGVTAYRVDLPLPSVVYAAGYEIRSRDYQFVRIDTDAGISGWGFTLGRGADVASIVRRNLSPIIENEDPLRNEHLWKKMYESTRFIGQQGMVIRAISMVDIALWDIKGKQARMPVGFLIGGNSASVPVNAVGGYYRDGSTPECLYDEVRRLNDLGYWGVKIAAGSLERTDDSQRLAAARKALGESGRLMADVNWCWTDLKLALRTAKEWEQFDLRWIEEPCPPENIEFRRQFRAASAAPLALGDEQYGRWTFRTWIERSAVDILRPDATVVGGITEYLKIAALASCYDLPLAPHYYPDVHIHLAAAFPHTLCVETFDESSGLDSFHLVRKRPLRAVDGIMRLPEEAGLGFEIDEEALEKYATRS
jgi:D-arabinonate dehydratase